MNDQVAYINSLASLTGIKDLYGLDKIGGAYFDHTGMAGPLLGYAINIDLVWLTVLWGA